MFFVLPSRMASRSDGTGLLRGHGASVCVRLLLLAPASTGGNGQGRAPFVGCSPLALSRQWPIGRLRLSLAAVPNPRGAAWVRSQVPIGVKPNARGRGVAAALAPDGSVLSTFSLPERNGRNGRGSLMRLKSTSLLKEAATRPGFAPTFPTDRGRRPSASPDHCTAGRCRLSRSAQTSWQEWLRSALDHLRTHHQRRWRSNFERGIHRAFRPQVLALSGVCGARGLPSTVLPSPLQGATEAMREPTARMIVRRIVSA